MQTAATHDAAERPDVGLAPYILLVDDNTPTLRSLARVVESAGHRCEAASSAGEALVCFDAQRPRVVVTDLTMPNLDGRGLGGWIHARHPSVPLILMTGQDLDAVTLADLERTFTAVLHKPLDIEQFLGLLGRLMPPDVTATPP